jgi:hypothetical protein
MARRQMEVLQLGIRVVPVVTNLNGSGWGAPHTIKSFLHHDARYEMQSGLLPGDTGIR